MWLVTRWGVSSILSGGFFILFGWFLGCCCSSPVLRVLSGAWLIVSVEWGWFFRFGPLGGGKVGFFLWRACSFRVLGRGWSIGGRWLQECGDFCFFWLAVPGDLNRCAQRRMGQCYFQLQTLIYLWASAERIYGFELVDFL